MWIKTLSLRNYRNIPSTEISPNQRLNIVIGSNAQGKTNLLEAIYYFAYLSSFRPAERRDLIFMSQDQAVVEASVTTDISDHQIRIGISPAGRNVRVDGKIPPTLKDYCEIIKLVLFSPTDVGIFHETPSTRRRFLRLALFLEDPIAWELEVRYRDGVQQKNRLLKEARGESNLNDQLAVWNNQLAVLGAEVTSKRLLWVERLNDLLGTCYQELTGTKDRLFVRYQADYLQHEGSASPSVNELREYLAGRIAERGPEELRRREALVGPHRDDWKVFLNDRPLSQYGSQGECRSTAVALRLAQVRMFEKKEGYYPIFLLDDLSSELDQKRVEACFDLLASHAGQVFVTSSSAEPIARSLKATATSFLVEGGKVRVLV